MLTQGVDSKIQLTEKHTESNSLSNFNAYFLSKCSIHFSIKITLAHNNHCNLAATECSCSHNNQLLLFGLWKEMPRSHLCTHINISSLKAKANFLNAFHIVIDPVNPGEKLRQSTISNSSSLKVECLIKLVSVIEVYIGLDINGQPDPTEYSTNPNTTRYPNGKNWTTRTRPDSELPNPNPTRPEVSN